MFEVNLLYHEDELCLKYDLIPSDQIPKKNFIDKSVLEETYIKPVKSSTSNNIRKSPNIKSAMVHKHTKEYKPISKRASEDDKRNHLKAYVNTILNESKRMNTMIFFSPDMPDIGDVDYMRYFFSIYYLLTEQIDTTQLNKLIKRLIYRQHGGMEINIVLQCLLSNNNITDNTFKRLNNKIKKFIKTSKDDVFNKICYDTLLLRKLCLDESAYHELQQTLIDDYCDSLIDKLNILACNMEIVNATDDDIKANFNNNYKIIVRKSNEIYQTNQIYFYFNIKNIMCLQGSLFENHPQITEIDLTNMLYEMYYPPLILQFRFFDAKNQSFHTTLDNHCNYNQSGFESFVFPTS